MNGETSSDVIKLKFFVLCWHSGVANIQVPTLFDMPISVVVVFFFNCSDLKGFYYFVLVMLHREGSYSWNSTVWDTAGNLYYNSDFGEQVSFFIQLQICGNVSNIKYKSCNVTSPVYLVCVLISMFENSSYCILTKSAKGLGVLWPFQISKFDKS